MIIHSPVISGSLTFAEGGTFTLPDNGVYSGSFSGSVNGIGDPETFSSSLDIRLSGLTIDTGSQDGRLDNLESFTSSIDSTIKTKLDTDGVISGSIQVDVEQTTNFTSFSSSIASTFAGLSSNYEDLIGIPAGIVSGSSQVSFNGIVDKPTLVSGSSQITLTQTDSGSFTTDMVGEGTNLYYTDARVKTKLDVEGVLSGSAQVSLSGFSTSDLSEGTNLYYTDARVKEKLDSETVISGSAQVDLASVTNNSTTNVSEGTNLYYTDARVKTKLDSETVVSGSGQILTLVSIDEDNMASNSDTKVPTQQSVKAYVDSEVAGLVDSAPGALDTLNELAAALGDDANFSTTISSQIAGKVSQSLEIGSGDGLTGGGNLTTNRTLVVGQGDGISVSADAVAVDATVLRTTGFGVVSGSAQVSLGGDLSGTANSATVTQVQGVALTSGEASQIANIGTTTISATQWGYVGALDQGLTQTSTVQFGKVGVGGASDATYELKVTGDIGATGDIVAYVSSDERLKDHIEPIKNPIGKVKKLRGVTWEWNSNASDAAKSSPNVGVIAQDVEQVLPQLVHDRENGYKGVDYSKLTGLLIEVVKEQQERIEKLEERLTNLEG